MILNEAESWGADLIVVGSHGYRVWERFLLGSVSQSVVCASAFGSYRAYEYTESVEFCGQACHTVIKPEFVAFHSTSHAKIRCVDCHVGHGAESYARSKLSGARQLFALVAGSYSKPIETPVHIRSFRGFA